MSQLARTEDLGDRLVVINANPAKRNVLSDAYYEAVIAAMRRAAEEPRIATVLLRGEGGFFCAGGDLRELAARREASREERLRAIERLHDVIRAIVHCPKPVIAVVEGGAAGAGVSIAFACDLVVAEDGASFTAAYVKAGLVPDGGLTRTLATRLPAPLAARMALLGEAIPARRLHEIGALSELAPAGNGFEVATLLADALARGPGAAQSAIKALLRAGTESDLDAQLARERDAMADAFAAPEAAEGIDAFLAKRPPEFARLRGEAGP